ncbi:DUF6319 family protein [Nocardia jinanensis]|uniref:Cell wall anchor protein n=1 Tax=Nocardia jinanensis TaxID=382504 RepID=A0A917RIA4_9NOCA|nr:DUF6319 family protein [Nocardia jinanensis]GGL09401.1 hypothetical protein GCM10011588_24720 [Nocardia jinanensis]
MPSRTPSNAKPKPLSDNDLDQIAAEIDAGRPPMVWFTTAAVGVTEGRSGKVVSLGDPADGDFLQIRPTGSKDVLSFGPTEVTLVKPQRDKPATPPSKPAPEKKEQPVTPAASPSTPAPSAADRKPAGEAPAAAKSAAPEAKPATASRTPAAAKATKAPAARKTKAPEVTVTINGTVDGEWTVDVAAGKKRTVRAVPVTGTAVAQAAKLLPAEVSEVVDGLLESVRGAQEAKVQQLQAELEQARKLLDELSD